MQKIRIQKYLFGRMFGIFIVHKVNIAKLLYCHIGDAICKTQTSSSMKSIEKGVDMF